MTCIAGFVQGGHVWLGGDSAVAANREVWNIKGAKVFARGPMVLGSAGSFRGAQVIEHAGVFPNRKPKSPEAYLVTSFIPSMMEVLLKFNVPREEDTGYLVGLGGRLFEIDHNFALIELAEPFAAIGSGAEFARGAYRGLLGVGAELDPEELLLVVLEAAAHCCLSVTAPFTFVSTGAA